jgi:hypothetical protein
MGGTKGRPFHHYDYRHLKRRYSIYWVDGLHIPKAIHVPIIHRILGGGDRPSKQAFGKFPNVAQRAAHWLLRLIYLPWIPFDRLAPWYARVVVSGGWGLGLAVVLSL